MFVPFNFDEQSARHEHFSSREIFLGRALDGKLARGFDIDAVKLDIEFVRRHPRAHLQPIG
jgi:hypothetical protein